MYPTGAKGEQGRCQASYCSKGGLGLAAAIRDSIPIQWEGLPSNPFPWQFKSDRTSFEEMFFSKQYLEADA